MTARRPRHDDGSQLYQIAMTSARPRVLLAEDDEPFRRLMAATLRRDGFEVIEVTNGRELVNRIASSMLNEERFDLIISDIRMPVMTGLDAVAGLRRTDWSIPVILITAFGDEELRQEALRLGVGAFFAKPFDLADLRTTALHLAGA